MDYRGMSLVRMVGINVLMSMMKREDIDPLRKLFQQIDVDRSGFITHEELAKAISDSEIKLSDEEATPEAFDTVESIMVLVNKHVAAKGA